MSIFETLDTYTADDLIKVKQYIDAKLETMKEEKVKSLLSEMKTWGISPIELNGASKEHGSKSTLAAKYRNPDDPTQTWVGRGKSPKWFQEKIESGVTKESMLIS